MSGDRSRREILLALASGVGLSGLAPAASPIPPDRAVRAFRLDEREGFRRRAFPIHAVLEGAGTGPRFTLLRDGRAIEAQFRDLPGPGGRPDVALDFEVDLEPGESRRYEVHHGLRVDPGPEPDPARGLRVERLADRFRIVKAGGFAFEIGPDLVATPGPFRGAGSPRLGFLKADASAIRFEGKGGEPILFDRGSARITRQGPVAVGLTIEAEPSAGGGPRATLDLTFPRSKPWMGVVLTIEDPGAAVAGLTVEFATLLDATGVATGPEARVEDHDRAVALVVGERARAGWNARAVAEAGGRIGIRAEPDPATAGARILPFWLLLEARPRPEGGRTSPGSMAHPPRLTWDRAAAAP